MMPDAMTDMMRRASSTRSKGPLSIASLSHENPVAGIMQSIMRKTRRIAFSFGLPDKEPEKYHVWCVWHHLALGILKVMGPG